MATDPQAIVDAIDAAILAWCDDPVSLTINGRSVTYRSLDELIRARATYTHLVNAAAENIGVQFRRITAGGPA